MSPCCWCTRAARCCSPPDLGRGVAHLVRYHRGIRSPLGVIDSLPHELATRCATHSSTRCPRAQRWSRCGAPRAPVQAGSRTTWRFVQPRGHTPRWLVQAGRRATRWIVRTGCVAPWWIVQAGSIAARWCIQTRSRTPWWFVQVAPGAPRALGRPGDHTTPCARRPTGRGGDRTTTVGSPAHTPSARRGRS